LYIAARGGFYDVCEMLLEEGADINLVQKDGSTALHGAAFYGHHLVVQLLLAHGADPEIQNKWGNTAEQEGDAAIARTIQSAKKDNITATYYSLLKNKLVDEQIKLIHAKGNVVGKIFPRDIFALDVESRRLFAKAKANWMPLWHGTQLKAVVPIMRNGLMPAGSKLENGELLKPPENHYALGTTHFGVENWANAIFVTPSLAYGAHACFSERVFSQNDRWCVLIQTRVKPNTYKSFDATVLYTDAIEGESKDPEYRVSGEPMDPEYRVSVEEDQTDFIVRVESARNVLVTAVAFISLNFLENISDYELDQDSITQLLFVHS